MALLNIGAGNKDDAFYRYKMPKMITKIEGRGNGIKTNIVNMVDIAKALNRPASYTTKYFGCELGAQSKFDEKTGTSHVNGSHETSKLSGLLEVFIKKYVQCYGCGNPETEIIITKSQMINLNCAACGFISEVDMRDKLTTFILKNVPDPKKKSKKLRRAEKERLKDGEVADEESKKLRKKRGSSNSLKDMAISRSSSSSRRKSLLSEEDHSPIGSQDDDDDDNDFDDDEDDNEDEVEWQTDTSLEAAKLRIQEQLSSVTAGMVMISTNEDESHSSPSAKGLKPVASRDRLDMYGKGLKSVSSRDRLDVYGKGMKSVSSRDRLDKMKDEVHVPKGLKSVSSRDRLDKMKDEVHVPKGLKSVSSRDRLDKMKDEANTKKLKHVGSRERLDKMKDNGQVSRLRSVESSDSLDKIHDEVLVEDKVNEEGLVGEIKDYLKKGAPAAGQLKSFLGSLSGTHQEIVDSLFEALFSEIGKGFSKEVVKKRNYLAAATREEGSKLALLHAIEAFCEKASPDAVKEVALVLKVLYDNDVVEEEYIFEWYQKGVKGVNKDSPMWNTVKPFVEWLQSAESESDDQDN